MATPTQAELERLSQGLKNLVGGLSSATSAVGAFGEGLSSVVQKLGQQLTGLVSIASPAHVAMFNWVLRDTMAVIGRMLIPTLERFTLILRKLGDMLASLDPMAKQLVAGLSMGAGLGAALAAVASAVAVVVRLLGGWVTILLGLVAAVAGVVSVSSEWGKLSEAITGILNEFGQVLTSVAAIAVPFVGIMAEFATILAPVVRLVSTLGMAFLTFVEIGAKFLQALVGMAFDAAADGIQGFTSAIDALVVRLRTWINEVRTFFGLAPLFEAKKGASTGAAVQQASITSDLRGILNRAYSAAAMVGTASGEDVPKQQLDSLKSIREILEQIPGLVWDKFVALYEYIKTLPMELATAIYNALPSAKSVGDAAEWVAGSEGRDAWEQIKPKMPGIGVGFITGGLPGAIIGGSR